jgi:Fe-S-cluster containining protein
MKFECKKCGKCCTIIKNNEKSMGGLPLFEWEKEELEKIALENGIKLMIGPTDLVFDKKSNSYICINFSLKQEPCVFLKDNKCSIYEKRPFICRYFPLAQSPLIIREDKSLDISSFLHCHSFDANKFLKENFEIDEGKPLKITKNKLFLLMTI